MTACLGYCMNIFPAPSYGQMLENLTTKPTGILAALGRNLGNLGIGMWLANPHLTTMQAKGEETWQREIEQALAVARADIFTLNGFPFGNFHAKQVKETVYHPNWSTAERLQYTLDLAEWLVRYGSQRPAYLSISTVPIAYRAHWQPSMADVCAGHLVTVICKLAELEDRCGKQVAVALEPEPDCVIDDLASTLTFWEDFIRRKVVPQLPGATEEERERLLQRHLGICLDTAHCAVVGDDPLVMLEELHRNHIRVVKIQVSTAMYTDVQSGNGAREILSGYGSDTYLHQTRVVPESGCQVVAYPDLPQALEAPAPDGLWRIHYHVPITWEGEGGVLTSSRSLLSPQFFNTAVACGVEHFEIETYTLPNFLSQTHQLENVIAEEIRIVESLSGLCATVDNPSSQGVSPT